MLLLTWDHPLDVAAVSARLIRGSVVVTEDVTWGAVADRENDDTSAPYAVEYLRVDGTPVLTIPITRKFKLPDTVCEVTFELARTDGTPDSNRLIEISDLHGASEPESTRTYSTNYNGKASVFLRRGAKQYIHLENTRLGLEVIVPDVASIPYTELLSDGSRVVHDRRGWF